MSWLRRLPYTAVLVLAAPLIAAYLLWRARRQPEYRAHWAERFGLAWPALPDAADGRRPLIWVHAVSVGETRAAEPLLAALAGAWPGHAILLTHMTPTGRATPVPVPGVARAYLPYDYPWAVRRFLRHYRPVLGVLLETEIWPNLVAGARAAGVPLALVNARLSERSLAKARRWGGLARDAVAGLDLVLAQTGADALRLAALGAKAAPGAPGVPGVPGLPGVPAVPVTGNLKFDAAVRPELAERGAWLRSLAGGRPVLLCASTREGEESLVLDAWARARASLAQHPLLVIVPRHPQRFDEVAGLIAARGLALERRSRLAPGSALPADCAVLLGDSMGEMQAWYRAADLAWIGGSLAPLGGQNLIEACLVGCPVLLGPHTFNFAQASDDAVAAGAALRIADADALFAQAARLLADRPALAAMGAAGERFARQHSGATARTMAHLAGLLAGEPGRTDASGS